MEFDAAVDAIKWLQQSPEMPPPTIHVADFGETLGIALQWADAERRVWWCRSTFRGEGEFDWMYCGRPPIDHDDQTPLDDDGGDTPVERGVPKAMADYVNAMTKESA
jgi:hypothetical protein